MMRTPVSCAGSSRYSSVQPAALLVTVGLKICAFPAGQMHALQRAAAVLSFSPLSFSSRLRQHAALTFEVMIVNVKTHRRRWRLRLCGKQVEQLSAPSSLKKKIKIVHE